MEEKDSIFCIEIYLRKPRVAIYRILKTWTNFTKDGDDFKRCVFPTAQVVASAQEAIKDVHDGATLCIGTLGGKLQLERFPIGATYPQSFLGSLDRVQPYKNWFADIFLIVHPKAFTCPFLVNPLMQVVVLFW